MPLPLIPLGIAGLTGPQVLMAMSCMKGAVHMGPAATMYMARLAMQSVAASPVATSVATLVVPTSAAIVLTCMKSAGGWLLGSTSTVASVSFWMLSKVTGFLAGRVGRVAVGTGVPGSAAAAESQMNSANSFTDNVINIGRDFWQITRGLVDYTKVAPAESIGAQARIAETAANSKPSSIAEILAAAQNMQQDPISMLNTAAQFVPAASAAGMVVATGIFFSPHIMRSFVAITGATNAFINSWAWVKIPVPSIVTDFGPGNLADKIPEIPMYVGQEPIVTTTTGLMDIPAVPEIISTAVELKTTNVILSGIDYIAANEQEKNFLTYLYELSRASEVDQMIRTQISTFFIDLFQICPPFQVEDKTLIHDIKPFEISSKAMVDFREAFVNLNSDIIGKVSVPELPEVFTNTRIGEIIVSSIEQATPLEHLHTASATDHILLVLFLIGCGFITYKVLRGIHSKYLKADDVTDNKITQFSDDEL